MSGSTVDGNKHAESGSRSSTDGISPDHPIEGHCNCGDVSYRIDATPLAVVACHCRQCRRQSGAAFSINLIVPLTAMHVTGALGRYEDRNTQSGIALQREFCPSCGSPIRSLPGSAPGIAAVKAGTLEKPERFEPGVHMWTESALPWIDLPGSVPCFQQGVPD